MQTGPIFFFLFFWILTKAKRSNQVKPQPNKEKKRKNDQKVSCEPRKEKPARPHNWSGSLKGFFIPGVHGKNPSGTAATASHGSSWKVLPGGGEANDLIAKKVNCFFLLKGKKPRRSCTMVCGTYQNIWQTSALWKNLRPFSFLFFPPTTDPSHSQSGPPDWPVSLFGPCEFKAGPLGAAQCALTPCNEISSCC